MIKWLERRAFPPSPRDCGFLVFMELDPCLISAMDDEPLQLPIDGVLDLHTFRPSDIKDLVLDYLAACREKGIYQVRIIHGKGIGNLRRTVHTVLEKHPDVTSFTLDHPQYGGWGATIVYLRK